MATKFITVSIDIMHDKNLTPNQKFILAEIEQLSQLDKGCIASNRHFSELIGIKIQGVSNAIGDLHKKGYIHIDNSNTKRNYGRVITIHSDVGGIHSDVGGIHSDVGGIHSDVESKENKTNNKTKYEKFIEELKEKSELPSKVTSTRKGNEFFKQIKDLERFTKSYLSHQKEKGEFAVRVTSFMEDYIPKQNNVVADSKDMSTWEDVIA